MDLRHATSTNSFPHSKVADSGTVTSGIFDNCSNVVLSDYNITGDSDLPSSDSARLLRDRQILERLFKTVSPDHAQAKANEWLDQFGSLASAMHAATDVSEKDNFSDILANMKEALGQCLLGDLHDTPILSTTESLISYLRFSMIGLRREEVRGLFLNGMNRLIRDETIARGTVCEAPIYPREIMKRCLELEATALILVHNHPSGDPTPSAADIEATHRLQRAGADLNIMLHDHIIIAGGGWVSLRTHGLLMS